MASSFSRRFYRHVIDTMSRIPFQQNGRVSEDLTYATRVMPARFNEAPNVGCRPDPKRIS
ncbi:MAG TPA: hypothetical protein VMR62_32165 [Bryobacteraceae bacterium]|jgi:hypothetical protein|nr:hypothetical protein [Bryobacteraceae bacterium]